MLKTDKAKVIKKATQVFWQKGYAATTMRDLQKAMDMRPGSIYRSIGGKSEIFEQALAIYTDNILDKIQSFAASDETEFHSLIDFIASLIFGDSDEPSRMCLLVKSISELDSENSGLVQCAKTCLKSIRKGLADLIEIYQREKVISNAYCAQDIATTIQSHIVGARLFVKLGKTEQAVKADINTLLQAYLIDKPS